MNSSTNSYGSSDTRISSTEPSNSTAFTPLRQSSQRSLSKTGDTNNSQGIYNASYNWK